MTIMAEPTAKDLKYLRWAMDGARVFSTCGKGKYMAVLVDTKGHVVGMGYNGGPKGMAHCEDGGCPRFGTQSISGGSYDNCIAIHAEANAFLHADQVACQGASLYVNGEPCFSCAKLIANSGVRRVVYLEGARDDINWKQTVRFLEACDVELVPVSL